MFLVAATRRRLEALRLVALWHRLVPARQRVFRDRGTPIGMKLHHDLLGVELTDPDDLLRDMRPVLGGVLAPAHGPSSLPGSGAGEIPQWAGQVLPFCCHERRCV